MTPDDEDSLERQCITVFLTFSGPSARGFRVGLMQRLTNARSRDSGPSRCSFLPSASTFSIRHRPLNTRGKFPSSSCLILFLCEVEAFGRSRRGRRAARGRSGGRGSATPDGTRHPPPPVTNSLPLIYYNVWRARAKCRPRKMRKNEVMKVGKEV